MTDSIAFLKAMFRNCDSGWMEIFLRPDRTDGHSTTLWGQLPFSGTDTDSERHTRLRERIAQAQSDGYGVHFGMAVRRTQKDRFHRGKKEDCTHITAIWGDIDSVSQEEGLSRIAKLPTQPTMTCRSGGGIHLYYFLKQPVEIKPGNMTMIERTVHGLNWLLHGDEAIRKINTTMRLPGTINLKAKYGEGGKPVEIIANTGQRHNYAELELLYAPLVAPPEPPMTRKTWVDNERTPRKPPYVEDYLNSGAPADRNNTLFRMACWYNNAGLSRDQAEGELIRRAVADGLTEPEAHATIRSAFKQAPRNINIPATQRSYMAHTDRIAEIRKRRMGRDGPKNRNDP